MNELKMIRTYRGLRRLWTVTNTRSWCAGGHLIGVGCYGELRPMWSAFGSLSRARPRCLSYHTDGRTRSPGAPHSADQVAPGYAVNTADGTAVDDARRSAGGPPCRRSSSKGHRCGRSMTSWRVDVGRPFVFHASCVARLTFAHSFSVAVVTVTLGQTIGRTSRVVSFMTTN